MIISVIRLIYKIIPHDVLLFMIYMYVGFKCEQARSTASHCWNFKANCSSKIFVNTLRNHMLVVCYFCPCMFHIFVSGNYAVLVNARVWLSFDVPAANTFCCPFSQNVTTNSSTSMLGVLREEQHVQLINKLQQHITPAHTVASATFIFRIDPN